MTTKQRYRPGPGWVRAGIAPVFDHPSGLRIHVHGLARLPDGTKISGTGWPESSSVARFIRICGGKRKRGIMVWAMHRAEQARKDGE